MPTQGDGVNPTRDRLSAVVHWGSSFNRPWTVVEEWIVRKVKTAAGHEVHAADLVREMARELPRGAYRDDPWRAVYNAATCPRLDLYLTWYLPDGQVGYEGRIPPWSLEKGRALLGGPEFNMNEWLDGTPPRFRDPVPATFGGVA